MLFGSINGGAFRALKLVAPPVELVAAFEAGCIHLDGSIENNAQQNCTLTALQNSLLPKLLSGEIRIRDAERQIGAAL